MPCLKDKLISDSPPSVPAPSSIPVEVEVIPEPLLESPLEPETNPVIPTPSSRTCSFSIPENPDPVLEGSDKEVEHLEAQAQALRDYQLARDRVCRTSAREEVPILTGSRTARSDWDWPPGLSIGVSPI
ncbi:hypothetical protein M9H77_06691 [Catharanthus roseus]|uniref:Uncharacterized protein n=1 Tax=Catharanthus roseus TaxID=4058 RepID=A0ACC0BSW9_CATRO|nr:hypothetical protein M9H77_06691 [Catharanthus roseus]